MTVREREEIRLAIAGASAAVAMHPQTLRKYERAGLLRPARRSGGSRHYSAEDIARLELIKQLADVRRINVAVTRARRHLAVLGDSATIAGDPFLGGFVKACDEAGALRSAWELDLGGFCR